MRVGTLLSLTGWGRLNGDLSDETATAERLQEVSGHPSAAGRRSQRCAPAARGAGSPYVGGRWAARLPARPPGCPLVAMPGGGR